MCLRRDRPCHETQTSACSIFHFRNPICPTPFISDEQSTIFNSPEFLFLQIYKVGVPRVKFVALRHPLTLSLAANCVYPTTQMCLNKDEETNTPKLMGNWSEIRPGTLAACNTTYVLPASVCVQLMPRFVVCMGQSVLNL